MGWQRRGNTLYYYAPRREGGRVRNRYFGRGPEAEALARQADAARRERDHVAGLKRLLGCPDALVEELAGGADRLLEVTLLVSGYHRRDRRWRPRHVRHADVPAR
ncbi:hypothetical protein OJF2_05770 [Aquisphaera giovannonii]|uniref:Uncharacterized protein n=1 Tax=Aquisphaera giovannonii TaxID=406548 RepID=A0A5B9VV13_9BACT|nr:hypothetical protein [Aquisphaera giovannonii]QEH32108.1 hypothetical protein OJF2_05770 [Aquisphaera giovannonii]